MRRVGIFLLALIALVAMAGPVSAQPKVTITGFVDNVTAWSKNMSNVDNNYGGASSKDREWYARTRVRPDITAEVGTTKFVLGLEIDETWGQTGNLGKAGLCGNVAQSANGALGGGTVCSSPQRGGATAGWDLNTDTQGVIEIKWAYTEFDLPILPMPTRVRLGAQPFETAYKLAVLANGDFAGVHVTSQVVPGVAKINLTYAQIEEQSTGVHDGFIRGDDFAFIGSVEITPFKGLDIRPIVSYAEFIGVTSGSARQARGGVATGAAVFPTCPGTTGPGTGGCIGNVGAGVGGSSQSAIEQRITVGVDARWRFGPFSFDPTVFYQFGNRDQFSPSASNNPATTLTGVMTTLKRDAWFIDLRGGWQAGPLLLEAAGIYTTGNKARDRIDAGASRLKYYEPIDTDTSYFATWAEIWALGIDYFSIVHSTAGGVNPGVAIGYDKYGLIRAGVRGSYALTPAFTVRAAASANWAAQDVDTSSNLTTGTGLIPRCSTLAATQMGGATLSQGQAANCVDNGTARYLGTEIDLGFQWRFAPNVAFDLVGAYMFAGNALSTAQVQNPTTLVVTNGRNPQDVQTVVARVRYSW
jgi:hypothetical protein